MAAIDFPASPTNNQVFVASNGVTYIWSSAYTAWQAQPLSAGYVGDFMATWTSGFGSWPAGTEFTMVFPTIFTGNAGGWYSTSNGRYTPPRGRYKVSAGYSCYSATAAIATQIKLRKNGADILPGGIQDASTASNQNTEVHQELILDLNGTDYIEVRAWTSGVPSGVNGAFFTAFPIAPNVNMTQGTGDFYATTSNAGLTASYATVLFNTILTGNASGAYASGTGRFTPPAGRYFLTTTLSAYWTAASTQLYVKIRKNGVDIPNIVAYSSSPTNSTYTTVTVQATVDASGTDYFDVHSLSTSGASGSSGWFGAYPISGIQGPPGPPPLGSLSLYSEKVCVGGETLMDVTIPPNCKRIELEYAIQAAAGDPARSFWLAHPDLAAAELTVSPEMAVVVAVRVH